MHTRMVTITSTLVFLELLIRYKFRSTQDLSGRWQRPYEIEAKIPHQYGLLAYHFYKTERRI